MSFVYDDELIKVFDLNIYPAVRDDKEICSEYYSMLTIEEKEIDEYFGRHLEYTSRITITFNEM